MPNWCFTTYVIEGEQKDLQCINKAICDVLDGKVPIQEKSSQSWEGNILHALRIPTENKNGNQYGHLRGFISVHPDLGDGILRFDAEEAWGPTIFGEMLRVRFKDINVYWRAEESGCETFLTNDAEGRHFPDKFYVDTCINDNYDSDYFCDEDAMWRWIKEISGCESMDEVELWNSDHADGDDFIYIHEFTIACDDLNIDGIELIPEPDRNLF